MKQLFHIENNDNNHAPQAISVRLGQRHACVSISGSFGEELSRLDYYTTDEWNENTLTLLFDSYLELNNSFLEVLIAYDYPQVTMIPSAFYKEESKKLLLDTICGEQLHSHILSESVAEWKLYTVYAVPGEVHDWLCKKYPSGKFWHGYSLDLKAINAANQTGTVQIDIRSDDFSLLAVKEDKLLLAQTFLYTTPEDIAYYVLKICHQFALPQRQVQLQLSGLIDKQSALYKELYQYFIHVSLRDAAWGEAGSEYPAHYFTSLNDLARCAS